MTYRMTYPDETAFGKDVADLARGLGWLESHTYRSKVKGGAWRTTTSAVGFPDHVLVGHGRLVVLELKMPGNKATPEQLAWVAAFDAVPGCDARVVYPADMPWITAALTPK